MQEEWKLIEDYPNYMISNLGNVRNINYRNTGKQTSLKGSTYNGYVHIALRKNNKSKIFLLHRLVAEAFIPNIENKPCINHIDCNRENNKAENLEWCTQQENITYMDNLNRRNSGKKLSEEEVKAIRKKKDKGLFYKDVWSEYKNTLSLSGFQKIWYGYTWKYLQGEDNK